MLSMTNNNNYFSLEGKFLIASPNMTDPRFIKSLIYMISDDIKGSMGIIINKPALDLDMSHFLNNYERLDNKNNNHTVFYGGPVEFDKGFVLHTNDYRSTFLGALGPYGSIGQYFFCQTCSFLAGCGLRPPPFADSFMD